MDRFKIRKVETRDHHVWMAFRKAVYEDDDENAHRAEMQSYFNDDARACFVLVNEEDEMVGLLEMSLRNIVDGCVSSPVGYIEGIYVSAAERGQGLGRMLTEKARAWALNKGCTELGTDALITNKPAQQFHQRMGFEEVDRVVVYKMSLR